MAKNPEKDIYEELNEIWLREAESEGLAKLPEDLSEKLREYVGSIKNYLKVSDRETLSAEIREAAANVIVKLVREIFELRLRKIVRNILRNEIPENLFGFELSFYSNAIKLVKDYRDKVREMATAVAYQDWQEIKAKHEVVYFLKDVSQIVGPNLKVYGPFKAGDIAALPVENARSLEIAGVVMVVKVLEPKL